MAARAQPDRDGPRRRLLLVLAAALLALLLCCIVGGWLMRCRGPQPPTPTPTATAAWPVVVATETREQRRPTATQAVPAARATASAAVTSPVARTPGPSPTWRHTPAATGEPATATPTAVTATPGGPPVTHTRTRTPPTPGLLIVLEGEPVHAVNAEPGVALPLQELTFRNRASSTVAAKYRLRATLSSGSSAFYDGINVRACRRAGNGAWPCYYDGLLRDMLLTPDAGQPGSTPGMVVSPGEAQRWRFTYTPDAGLGNWAQGASCTFSIVAEATEAGNPGWLP